MSVADTLIFFAANYAFIALKAWQQRNVAFNNYLAVLPTSWLIAAAEVYVIATVADKGFGLWVVLTLGTAGGLGAMTAMYLHGRVFKQSKP